MATASANPVIAAILGNVKATKSVICCVLAFIEAVLEEIEKPEGVIPLREIEQKAVKPNGVVAQGRRAAQHLERFGLPTANIAGDKSGRKTPQAPLVIPRLVFWLESQDFDSAEAAQKVEMLLGISVSFREKLGLSLGPIRVTLAGKGTAAIVEEVLQQAEVRGIGSAIAELLVGSKLEVCLGEQRGLEIAGQHKWENGHDDPSALGDYRIENVAIEVTMVRGPDESHRTKANLITAHGIEECWLIVRSDKIKAWQDYLAKAPSKYPTMIRCFGICEFIGQNLTETKWRSTASIDPVREVIAKLNEQVARLGSQFLPAARVDLVG